MNSEAPSAHTSWLNRTTLGIGLTSLFSDWSHEIATAILPAFLASLGVGPGWLGVIEGTADGLSSFSKLAAGHYTDRLKHRKVLVQSGYVVTTLATGALALATSAWHVLIARTTAWLGRGIRTPGRKALLAAGVSPDAYGRAFGFERMMDTLGAVVAPITALAWGADARIFAAVSVVLLTVALLACLLPAQRATRAEPAAALRED